MICKIPPDSKQTIQISFLSNVEKVFNSQIELIVRGGKAESIPV
jgi:citrate lyase gamma subunit